MKHVLATLAFFSKYPGRHAFARDRATAKAVRSLESRGYLSVDWPTRTATFTGKTSA